MTRAALRRIACVGAMLGLGVAASPRVQAAPAAPVTPATAAAVSSNHAPSPSVIAPAQQAVTGRGWGSMLACAGCVVAATGIVAAGPAAIIYALYMPGGALALMTCAAACYEAFQ